MLARWLRSAVLSAMLLALWPAVPARAFEPRPQRPPVDYADVGGKIFDAAALRPLGVGATLIGGAAFLIAAPLAWYAEGIESLWDTFVMGPVDFTFLRPLGDF